MREDEGRYYDATDYDAKSCADYRQLPGRGLADIETNPLTRS